MEKSDQKEVEYMRQGTPWIDTRLTEEEMTFLRDAISKENKESMSNVLAGNINRYFGEIIDKEEWFYESALKKLTEKIFYREENNYYKYHIEVEEGVSLPKFELRSMWVNYQKQHEFNPLHDHGGLYSFVVFMKIPTHWKEQHALPISANSGSPSASDFAFVWSNKGNEMCENTNFQLSPEDEGRMLFFPAWLKHMVYPFYECEEERITISGNIVFVNPNKPKKQEMSIDQYEEKENMLKMMKNGVQQVEEELKQMKKVMEKLE